MIALDIDGVLVSDIDFSYLENFNNVYSIRNKINKPLFEINGEYVLISGRNILDENFTWEWACKNLKNLPKKIYFNDIDIKLLNEVNKEYHSAIHKARILNSLPEIQIYIESNIREKEYIEKNLKTGCEVVLFSELINKTLVNL